MLNYGITNERQKIIDFYFIKLERKAFFRDIDWILNICRMEEKIDSIE